MSKINETVYALNNESFLYNVIQQQQVQSSRDDLLIKSDINSARAYEGTLASWNRGINALDYLIWTTLSKESTLYNQFDRKRAKINTFIV